MQPRLLSVSLTVKACTVPLAHAKHLRPFSRVIHSTKRILSSGSFILNRSTVLWLVAQGKQAGQPKCKKLKRNDSEYDLLKLLVRMVETHRVSRHESVVQTKKGRKQI